MVNLKTKTGCLTKGPLSEKKQKNPLISIIIPVFNEEKNIRNLYQELGDVFRRQLIYDFEYIFINDGSTDKSRELILEILSSDSKVKYIEFSRNFGKEKATSAGIRWCSGQAAVIIDADSQHPPGLIPEFIRRWEAGADMVIGQRRETKDRRIFNWLGSWVFNQVMAVISESDFVPGTTDFRLIDRCVINEFNNFTERNRLTRGLLDWLGFKKDYVEFKAKDRRHGDTRYSKIKLIRLAFSSVVAYSLFPLRIAGYLGLVITCLSCFLGFFIFIEKYLLNDPWGLNFSGPAMLAVLNLFLIGVVLISLGLVALYIANIHREVTNRPMYIIKNRKNFTGR